MTWLDILVLIICIVAFLRGLKTGLVMQVASLVGIVLGAIFAGKIAEFIYPYLEGISENTEYIVAPASYLIGFILILVLVNILGRMLHHLVHAIFLGAINRVIGAVFSVAKWILIISILLNLTVQFDRNKTIIKAEVREQSHTYPILTNIAQTIIPYLRFDNLSTSLQTLDSPQPPVISI